VDRSSGSLKLFDPCECAFEAVPCLGGKGDGPRNFSNPHGLSIRGDTLYLCDTGNRRVMLLTLKGFLLRGEWAPPREAGLDVEWQPYDLVFDRQGIAYVSDPANQCVHRFNAGGVWLGRLSGYSEPRALAVDCQDRLYVLCEGLKPHVVRSALDGTARVVLRRHGEAAGAFPALPVTVDEAGRIDLGSLCGRQAAWFDPSGNPLKSVPSPKPLAFETQGIYLSEPLDSAIQQCQWHRLVLHGELPAGTRIRVATFTAESPQPPAMIQALSDAQWHSRHLLHGHGETKWDGLITSGPGRYLWLRLTLESNGETSPRIDSLRIEFPRISLRRYLPAVFAEDPAGADFTDRLLSLFDTTLRSIESRLDHQAAWFDPLAAPATPAKGDFLSWLAGWIGLSLDRQWPDSKRRQLLRQSASLYARRGTRSGLHAQLLFFLGMQPDQRCCKGETAPRQRCAPPVRNCQPVRTTACRWQAPPLILEHFQLRRWLHLCQGRLGDQAVLWGKRIVNRSQLDEGAQVDGTQLIVSQEPLRDPFHVHAHRFSVFVPACYGRSETDHRALQNLIEQEQPAHTQYRLVYVEPRFRIGFQSSIGLDAVVGRYPEGVALGESPLGQSTVLGRSAHRRGGPDFEVGVQARVGGTTRLN